MGLLQKLADAEVAARRPIREAVPSENEQSRLVSNNEHDLGEATNGVAVLSVNVEQKKRRELLRAQIADGDVAAVELVRLRADLQIEQDRFEAVKQRHLATASAIQSQIDRIVFTQAQLGQALAELNTVWPDESLLTERMRLSRLMNDIQVRQMNLQKEVRHAEYAIFRLRRDRVVESKPDEVARLDAEIAEARTKLEDTQAKLPELENERTQVQANLDELFRQNALL